MPARRAGPGQPLLFFDRVEQDDLHPLAYPRDRHHNMTAVPCFGNGLLKNK